jgi:hypothetical protein
MNDADAGTLLPTGTRLLHIGPHKTGTTALQSAFHAHRADLETQGVHYTGPNRQPMGAAHAITGAPSPYSDGKAPPIGRWNDLVGEVRGARAARVVISSEGFADAEPSGIARVVGDLDASRLQVVLTLRPLAAILPSQWQQYVQGGMTLAYEDWLRAMFDAPGNVTPGFWHRHRHDALVNRWAAAAGADHVTVIVGDERDHERQLRVFECLLGLREGTLVPEANLGNRSLTWPEVESLRAFNAAFRAEGLGTQLHTKVVRFGSAELLKQRTPAPGEPRIQTPAWALERAAAIQAEIVDGIAKSGVRVLGDLAALAGAPAFAGAPARAADASAAPPAAYDVDAVWSDVGATMALGVVLASGLARGDASKAWQQIPWPDGPLPIGARPPRARVEPLELARVSTPLLGLILVRRLTGAAVGRLRPAKRPR